MNAWLIHHYQNHVVRFSREKEKKNRCVLASMKMFMSARIHALVIDARAIRVHTIKTRTKKPASKRNEKQTDRSIHAYKLIVLRERIHRGHVHPAHYFMSFYVHISTNENPYD